MKRPISSIPLQTMKQKTLRLHPKGFALVVTLSLMILLTVIAVGLLSLSSISLRSSSQGNAMATAKANARLALMLAIGELQKNAGPDTRITAPANLVNNSASSGITGVWKSWRPPFSNPNYDSAKAGSNFLGYLMSNPDPGATADPQTLPSSSSGKQQLVGNKSVGTGNTSAEISAPLVNVKAGNAGNSNGAFSYVTLDEGMKGRIDLLPSEEAEGLGEQITQVGSSARNGFETVEKMEFLKEDRDKLKETLPKLVTLNQANLESSSKDAVSKYFHDFTVSSNSLQTDVANGGLKTDLSVLFEGASGASLSVGDYGSRYLYSDTPTPFQGSSTTSDVQWSLYANYARLYRRTTTKDNPKDGMKATVPAGFEKPWSDSTLRKTRYEPNMAILKQPVMMPTVARIDTVFSIVARDNHHTQAGYPYMLHLMYLPVITLHNPYNVPLRVTGLQVEFSDIPIGFEFLINGVATNTSGLMTINQLYSNESAQRKTFKMQLSNSLSGATEVVMGAGETRIFGTPFSANNTWAAEIAANGSQTGMMFDWQSNQTAAAYTMPGMITSSKSGIGFDVDWLAPSSAGRAAWVTARKNDGVLIMNDSDTIKVRYGPKAPATATDKSFAITLRIGTGTPVEYAKTQVFYESDSKLKTIMEEGVSDRFPDKRSFPETVPRSSESPISPRQIYEASGTPIKNYALARPFAIFSVSAKTTMESFTKSRPVADTGVAFQMATVDFTGTKSSGGSSPLEFALVPVKQGGNVIESGGVKDSRGTSLQGFLFGGHGSTRGTNNATFYEIPMAPLQSIAQLRHANAGSLGAAPYVTYTIGEARAHPALPSDAVFSKVDSSRTLLDRSWLANDQLWDKYWFSTLSTLQGTAYTGSAASTQEDLAADFFGGVKTLPNPRNVAYIPGGKSVSEVATASRETLSDAPYTQSANYMLTRGGFNVNSTSIPAWTSVLSALSTTDIPLANGATEKDPAGTPFLRVRQPVGGSAMLAKEKLWNGYRTLEANEIATLAKEIVEEVKARGPFLSMSEFVNRRLGSKTDAMSQKGAIQAALDRTNLNSIMELNARTVAPSEASGYGWANESAVDKNTGAGAPGEVSQGDVLSSIGSFISVRSDTFRIRTYGDARNAAGGILARAWCEATIQRVPEYVDSTDLPTAIPTTPSNTNFGRQFKVVAFRWLSSDEI